MGRSLSTDLQNILASQSREAEMYIDITFPGSEDVFRFATAPLTIGDVDYVNDVESVREIKQTLEAPSDRVGVVIQNKDRVLGLHVKANPSLWQRAESVISRQYRSDSLTASLELFRGAIQQPFVDDTSYQVTFDIVPDTLTPGTIVANRNLGLPCPWRYKDPRTCASVSARLLCNHLLKSPEGCEGDDNTHHFGGMEHNQDPDQRVPGTPGNPDDPSIPPSTGTPGSGEDPGNPGGPGGNHYPLLEPQLNY